MSLVQEYHQKSKAFHAEIARRASLVVRRQTTTYFVPNTPFRVPKPARPPAARPPRNIEPDYWHLMWFHDLVFGRTVSTPHPITVEAIIRAVCHEFEVRRLDLISSRRTARIVLPRQIAMHLAKVLTLRSLPEIGRRMGGRDHTTILHGVRKIEALAATDIELAGRIEKIKASLG